MANHHLTGMLVNGPLCMMPTQAEPFFIPAQTSLCVMPAQTSLCVMPAQTSLCVMPAKAGIHPSRSEYWIPACAGMTAGGRVHTFDTIRREAARLAAEAEDMAELQDAEKAAAKKRRNKESEDE